MPYKPGRPGRPPLAPADHPALSLKLGAGEKAAALAKLNPVKMPNQTIVEDLQKSYPQDKRWRVFRDDPDYILVNHWMLQCRGYVKLALDNFDTDSFEMDLFGQVPDDEETLLLSRLRVGLLLKIHGKKALLSQFEPLFRVYFGCDTPLKGPKNSDDYAAPDLPRFDDLFIDEKYHILALLVAEVTLHQDFRDFIDKNNLSPVLLRPETLWREAKGAVVEEFIVIFDGTAGYKRTTKARELVVPKKRDLAPADPDSELGPKPFDTTVSYEQIFRGIYELDALVAELLTKKTKKNKAILDVLKHPEFVENMYDVEMRKRRVIHQRRKESEMSRLLATRKRSLRLEAKEKIRAIEEQERKDQELEDLQYAVMRRSSRNTRLTPSMDYTGGVTREQRLRKRLESSPEISEASAEPTEITEVKNEDSMDVEPPEPVAEEKVLDQGVESSGNGGFGDSNHNQEVPLRNEDSLVQREPEHKPFPNNDSSSPTHEPSKTKIEEGLDNLQGSILGPPMQNVDSQTRLPAAFPPRLAIPETMPLPQLAGTRENSEGPPRPNPTPQDLSTTIAHINGENQPDNSQQ